MDQIIHYFLVPEGVCSRKDDNVDEMVVPYEHGTITHSALATFRGNVTCKRCKQWMKASQKRREAMIVGKRELHAV